MAPWLPVTALPALPAFAIVPHNLMGVHIGRAVPIVVVHVVHVVRASCMPGHVW